MIVCPVCKKENDIYSTICYNCGSFLQNRIANLDLFHTIWKVIENPKEGFKIISLSEHKNYSLFLFSLVGIYLIFKIMWFFALGNILDHLFYIIFFGLISGIPSGIALSIIVSVVHWLLIRLLGSKSSFVNSFGILSYSMIPIIFSLIMVQTLQLMTFGVYFFTFNPHPLTIKPEIYIILLSIDGLCVIWSLILSIIGTFISSQLSVIKSIIVSLIISLIFIGSMHIGGNFLLNYI